MELAAPAEGELPFSSLSPIAPSVSPLTTPPQSPRDEDYDFEATIEDMSTIDNDDDDDDDMKDAEDYDGHYEGNIEWDYETQIPTDTQIDSSPSRPCLADRSAPIGPLAIDLEEILVDDNNDDDPIRNFVVASRFSL
ncbi:hypothetical protein TWF506_010613 [Arthrobotrys conoides]|uniref:Uncharacterized protein n=1 Tax=Arthrobotrys conoides TaxID=74498 RepID=A0AAN8PC13_9PEZI